MQSLLMRATNAYAQADLSLRWAHMLECMYSYAVTHIDMSRVECKTVVSQMVVFPQT